MKKTEWVNIGGINYPVVVDCTAEEEEATARQIAEAEAQERQQPPTQLDIIEAQLAYTALMTDTLIEEGE